MKKYRLLSIFMLLLFVTAGLVVLVTSFRKPPNAPPDAKGIVAGYVFTKLMLDPEVQTYKEVYLPDVTVTLSQNGVVKATVITRCDGSYRTPRLPKGTYILCMKKTGYTDKCITVVMNEYATHPGPQQINLADPINYVYGSVLLRDGKVGYYDNPVFGIKFHTTITATATGVNITEKCNTAGEYVLPKLKLGVNYNLKAICQSAVTNTTSGGQKKVDIQLPNTSPVIRAITGTNGALTPIKAQSAAILTVKADAKDSEFHTLHYKWVAMGNFPGSSFPDNATAQWNLPPDKGRYQLFLLVYDNYGAVAYQEYNIAGGDPFVRFSGVIRDIRNNSRIAGARVVVNGSFSAVTDVHSSSAFRKPAADVLYYQPISRDTQCVQEYSSTKLRALTLN
jgi:hypothetical protein